jgi:hypothetical protein
MMFGRNQNNGNNDDKDKKDDTPAQSYEVLDQLPTYDCKINGHAGPIYGPNDVLQCSACGEPL